MKKKLYRFLLLAVVCMCGVGKAADESDDDLDSDIEIAREYHRLNPSKQADNDMSNKTSLWKVKAYAGAVMVALVVYGASSMSDDEQ